jgi:hypothetical protein
MKKWPLTVEEKLNLVARTLTAITLITQTGFPSPQDFMPKGSKRPQGDKKIHNPDRGF